MKTTWRVLLILKIGFLAFAAAASWRLGSPYPLAIFAIGFLAVNLSGIAWGLQAGARAGLSRKSAALRTLLLGSSWWAPVLSGKEPPGKGRGA